MNTQAHTWIEISKDAFDHNVRQYKTIIGHDRALGVVVKSNAYGHGMAQMAPLCQHNDAIEWLFVSSLSEALLLRSLNVTKHILVMCLLDADPAQAIALNIDMIIFDKATLERLNACGITAGKPARVHLKIDTGMSRFGFYAHEVIDIIHLIQTMSGITLHGLYTHFSESEKEDQTFTRQQLQQFTDLIAALETRGIQIPYKHACNTAATTMHDVARFNVVRVGAGNYGLLPSVYTHRIAQEKYPDFSLRQIMTWKTTIMHMRTIAANTPIGYGRTNVLQHESTIALLPVGYVEGYDRRLANKGRIYFPRTHSYGTVAGRICMNVIMVLLENPLAAHPGDEAVLIGDYQELRAFDIAQLIEGYNAREITSRMNPLITRIVV